MKIAAWGFLSLALATVLGAFGTHSLRGKISESSLAVFQTGQQYHVIASLALIAIGLLQSHHASVSLKPQGLLLGLGAIVFSGSLYALALSGARILGAVTPVGGLMMIVAYCWTAWVLFRTKADA